MTDFSSSITPQRKLQSSSLYGQALPSTVTRNKVAAQVARIEALKTQTLQKPEATSASSTIVSVSKTAIQEQEITVIKQNAIQESRIIGNVKALARIFDKGTPPGAISTQIAHPKTIAQESVHIPVEPKNSIKETALSPDPSLIFNEKDNTSQIVLPEQDPTYPDETSIQTEGNIFAEIDSIYASLDEGMSYLDDDSEISNKQKSTVNTGSNSERKDDLQYDSLHKKTIYLIDTSALLNKETSLIDTQPTEKKNIPENRLDSDREKFEKELKKATEMAEKITAGGKLTYVDDTIEVIDRNSSIFSPLLQKRVANKEETKKALSIQLDELSSLVESCKICGTMGDVTELENTIRQFLNASWTNAALNNNHPLEEKAKELESITKTLREGTAKAVLAQSITSLQNNALITSALAENSSPEAIKDALSLINREFASGLGIGSTNTIAQTIFSDRTNSSINTFRQNILKPLNERILHQLINRSDSEILEFIDTQPDKRSLYEASLSFENEASKKRLQGMIATSNLHALLKLGLDPKYKQTQLATYDPALRKKMEESLQHIIGGVLSQEGATLERVATTLLKIANEAASSDDRLCDNIAKFCEKWISTNHQLEGFKDTEITLLTVGEALRKNLNAHHTRIENAIKQKRHERVENRSNLESISTQNGRDITQILNSATQATAMKEVYQQAVQDIKNDFHRLASQILQAIPTGVFAVRPADLTKHPAIVKATAFLQNTSEFLKDHILQIEDASERQRAIQLFIDISYELAREGNFFSANAILSGLNSASIARLFVKQDHYFLDTSHQNKFIELADLFSTSSNSKAIRSHTERALKNKQFCIPLINIYQTDRTFISDGNTYTGNITHLAIGKCADLTRILSQAKQNKFPEQKSKTNIAKHIFDKKSTTADEASIKEAKDYALSMKLVPRSTTDIGALLPSHEKIQAFQKIVSKTRDAQKFLVENSDIGEFVKSVVHSVIDKQDGKPRNEKYLEIQGEILVEIQSAVKSNNNSKEQIAIQLAKYIATNPLLSSFRENVCTKYTKNQGEFPKECIEKIEGLAESLVLENPSLEIKTVLEEIRNAYIITLGIFKEVGVTTSFSSLLEQAPLSGILENSLQNALVNQLISEKEAESRYDLIAELMHESPSTESKSISERKVESDGISLSALPLYKKVEYQSRLMSMSYVNKFFKSNPHIKQLCKAIAEASTNSISGEKERVIATADMRIELYETIQNILKDYKKGTTRNIPINDLVERALFEVITTKDSSLSPAMQRKLLLEMVGGSANFPIKRQAFESKLFENEISEAASTLTIFAEDALTQTIDQLSSKAIRYAIEPFIYSKSDSSSKNYNQYIKAGIARAIKEAKDTAMGAKINFFQAKYDAKIAAGGTNLKSAHDEFMRFITETTNALQFTDKEIEIFNQEADLLLYSAIYEETAHDFQSCIEALRHGIDEMQNPIAQRIAQEVLKKEIEDTAKKTAEKIASFFHEMQSKHITSSQNSTTIIDDLTQFEDVIRDIHSYTNYLRDLSLSEEEIGSKLDSFTKMMQMFLSNLKTTLERSLIDKQEYTTNLESMLESTLSEYSLIQTGFTKQQITTILGLESTT